MVAKDVILVLGAGGLLGPVWIKYLLEKNNDIQVIGTKLSEEKSNSGIKIEFKERYMEYDFDVKDLDFEKKLTHLIHESGINKIIYNIGIDTPPETKIKKSFDDYTDEVFNNTLNINITGFFKVAKVLNKLWVDKGGGSVVCIGSIYGGHSPDQRYYNELPGKGIFHKSPAYGTSKAGLTSLVKYLAALWGQYKIRVNVVSPGGVFNNQHDTFLKKYIERVPLNRLADADKDIAPLIYFLLSDQASYITGQEILVDGGYGCW